MRKITAGYVRYKRKTSYKNKAKKQEKTGSFPFALLLAAIILLTVLFPKASGIKPEAVEAKTASATEASTGKITITEVEGKTEEKAAYEFMNLLSGSDSIKALSTASVIEKNTKEPTILIYHTHTLEAYTPSKKYDYKEKGGKWRTTDNTRNIVAVGEILKDELTKLGYNVIHDTENHEPPKLSTAYTRSEATMKKYKDKYPSLVMFIDVHRDACGEAGAKDFAVIDGEETARLMFVVGTGKGATGTGFSEMPDFDNNYALAKKITDILSEENEKLVREIRVKKGRYNQHISSSCLLVEVGHNMNTLEQAIAAAKRLAKAIDKAIVN